MEKKILILFILGIVLPFLVLAQIEISNPIKANTFEELLGDISNVLFWLALALFPLMMVVAGLLFVTAAGDKDKIEKAKNIILYSAIGLLVILLSAGFINLLLGQIGV